MPKRGNDEYDGGRGGFQERHGSPQPSTAATLKRRRTNVECCDTCRLRKVKCGGRAGSEACENCSRLKLACGFSRSSNDAQTSGKLARITPTGTITEAGTLRKRAQRACSNCHRHKAKCSGDLPSCSRCQTHDLTCEYAPSKRKFANLPASPVPVDARTPPATASGPNDQSGSECDTPPALEFSLPPGTGLQNRLLKRNVVLTHMDVYFESFWYIPCQGILHPATTYRLLEEDKLSPHLAAAVVSLTATVSLLYPVALEASTDTDLSLLPLKVVSNVSEGRLFAAQCNEQVEQHLMKTFGQMCPNLLVLHAFVTTYNWQSGPLSKVWMWTSTAARLIKCLQLNYDPDCNPAGRDFAQQETLRRTVWLIWVIDQFLAGGFNEHLLLPSPSMHLKLPCSDEAFKDGTASTALTLKESSLPPSPSPPSSSSSSSTFSGGSQLSLNDFSLNAALIRLLNIRSQILSSTKRMSEVLGGPQASSFSSKDFMDTINKFQVAVNRFKESLPEQVKLCPQSIHDYVSRPDRTAFITLHLWVAQTHMDLYRFSMPKLKKTAVPEYPEDLPWEWLDMAQRQATAYAIHQAQFWTYQLHIIQEKGALSKALMTVDWMIGACAVDCSTLLLAARKHELWRRDLKEGSTAPLCLAKPIDDDMLEFLVSSLVNILETLKPFIPRIESYQRHILNKAKLYMEDGLLRDGGHLGPWIAGIKSDQPAQGVQCHLLGMGRSEVCHNAQHSASSSSTEGPLSRRPSELDQKRGLSESNGPPIVPYCLKKAREEPAGRPPSPPVSEGARSIKDVPLATAPNAHGASRIEAGIPAKSREPLLLANTGTTAFNNYPELQLNTQIQFPTPAIIGVTEASDFGPYTMPYVFQDEDLHGGWWQQPVEFS